MTNRAPGGLYLERRLVVAVVIGVVVAVVLAMLGTVHVLTAVLIGYVAGSLAFCAPLLITGLRLDGPQTTKVLDGVDPTRSVTDVLVVVSAFAALAGIATVLINSKKSDATLAAVVAVLTVASAWLAVHTMYTVRYAKHYTNAEPGCIEFNADPPPRLSDFAYLSFTLGMTYQVSDTNLKTPAIRRIVLAHTLLSYVFGTVVIASTINLVVGLAP